MDNIILPGSPCPGKHHQVCRKIPLMWGWMLWQGSTRGALGWTRECFGHPAGTFPILLSLVHSFAQVLISSVSKQEEIQAGLGSTPDLSLSASPAHPSPATAIISCQILKKNSINLPLCHEYIPALGDHREAHYPTS